MPSQERRERGEGRGERREEEGDPNQAERGPRKYACEVRELSERELLKVV